jgi:hypothetical protein
MGAEHNAHCDRPQSIQARVVNVFQGKDAEAAFASLKLNPRFVVSLKEEGRGVLFSFIAAKPRKRLSSALLPNSLENPSQ